MREDLLGGHVQGPGVQRIYRGVIFVTIGMFAGYASKQAFTRAAIARVPTVRRSPSCAPRAAMHRSTCCSTPSWSRWNKT